MEIKKSTLTTSGRAFLSQPNLRPIAEDWEWQYKGNCAKLDPNIFFLDGGERMSVKDKKEEQAKAVCVGCPVILDCLTHALSVPEYFGVWGGTTPEERELLRKKAKLNNKLTITQSTNNTDKE